MGLLPRLGEQVATVAVLVFVVVMAGAQNVLVSPAGVMVTVCDELLI
jgi:hypothetical protein